METEEIKGHVNNQGIKRNQVTSATECIDYPGL